MPASSIAARLDDHGADAGVAGGEGLQAQQHEGTDDLGSTSSPVPPRASG
jgi:hypothetical protein